jgi:hypothetical protein
MYSDRSSKHTAKLDLKKRIEMESEYQRQLELQISQGADLATKILKRNDLLRSLHQLNTDIAALCSCHGTSEPSLAEKVEASKPIPKTVEEVRKRRSRSKTSLSSMIMESLASEAEGLTKSEITKNIFERGYESTSAHPDRLIYQALYNLQSKKVISQGSEGRYKIFKSIEGDLS